MQNKVAFFEQHLEMRSSEFLRLNRWDGADTPMGLTRTTTFVVYIYERMHLDSVWKSSCVSCVVTRKMC